MFYSCQRTVALSLSLCWRAIFSPCHTKSCWIGSRICFRWCEIGRSVIARSIDLICFPELHSFLFSRHASLTSRYSMCYRFVYFSSIEQHRYAISFQRINRCPVDTFWQDKNHYSLDSDLSGRWRYPLNNWDQKASLESKYWIKWELQRACIQPGRAEQNYSHVCTTF